MIRLAILLLCLAFPALAVDEKIITPEEFEQLSSGKTLYFTQNGSHYGIERFYENRQTVWQYGDGTCTDGRWFPDGNTICFVYDANAFPQCWYFTQRGDDFFARTLGQIAESPSELMLDRVDNEPVPCSGPNVGV